MSIDESQFDDWMQELIVAIRRGPVSERMPGSEVGREVNLAEALGEVAVATHEIAAHLHELVVVLHRMYLDEKGV